MNGDITAYQRQLKRFDKYPDTPFKTVFYALGMAGETGEVCEKIKKLFRDHDGKVTPEFITALKKEIGDVLWYMGSLCNMFGIKIEDCAKLNIEKLTLRECKNMIHGDGDAREEEKD